VCYGQAGKSDDLRNIRQPQAQCKTEPDLESLENALQIEARIFERLCSLTRLAKALEIVGRSEEERAAVVQEAVLGIAGSLSSGLLEVVELSHEELREHLKRALAAESGGEA
jgi:hypothetical protein